MEPRSLRCSCSLTGALLGARLLSRAPTRMLRLLFTAVVVVLATQMLYKGLSGAIGK